MQQLNMKVAEELNLYTEVKITDKDKQINKLKKIYERVIIDEVENKLIAYSFLSLFEKSTKKHNCILGIVIGDNWQNKGYGKKICEKMIEDAWKNGLEKIWLTVHFKNKKAIELYKLLGFEVEGIFINDEIFEEKYQTIISMARFKNKIEVGKRLKIWKEIEKDSF